MRREVALTEYFDAVVTANESGKIEINVYATAADSQEHSLYQEFGHADAPDGVKGTAQAMIDTARRKFKRFNNTINAAHLQMELICTGGASVSYRLKAPGGHLINITGTIEHNGCTDTLIATFKWYRGRGRYSPSIKRVWTDNLDIGYTNDTLTPDAAQSCIGTTVEAWKEQVEKIQNNETDSDKIEAQLNELN